MKKLNEKQWQQIKDLEKDILEHGETKRYYVIYGRDLNEKEKELVIQGYKESGYDCVIKDRRLDAIQKKEKIVYKHAEN